MHNQTGILSKGLSYLLMFLVTLQPTLAEAQQGKIVVDPNSSAQIDQTFNKTPLLQIERPNASGVSHNKFTDFNVGSKGLVINNALKETISKTGGAIFKNPNFQGRAASLILNEVTSSNRSSLNGFTEIAGQKADYILANPNGITCNGCGFINTSRSTLTTGTPVFNGTSLEQLSVDQGDVLIEGLGLNAEGTDAFDIITRSTKLMAQLNAKDVNIITGRNEVTYQDRAVTAKTDDGSVKPSLAIDSSTLGGMYAGRIALVATEHGLGVNMQGDMAASASDLSISADGKILVTNVQSQNNLTLQSKNNAVTLSGNASAKGKIDLQAKDDVVAQNNRVTATSDISIIAQNIDVAGAKVIAGVNDAGDVQKGQGNLKLTARDTLTYGAAQLAAGKDLSITAQTVDSGDASQGLTSKGSLTVDATTMSKTSGGIVSEGDLSLKVTSLGLTDTGVTSKAALNVRTNDFTNSAQLSSVGDLAFNVSGSITNEAGAKIDSDGTLSLTSTGASITNRGMLRGKQAVNLDAATFITNESTGSITSDGTLKLDAKGGALQNSGTIETTGDMTAQASTNILNNNGAKLAATGTLNSTAAGDFTNNGVYAGLAEQTVTANNLTNTGILKSDGNLTANVSNNLTNSQTIKARGDLTLYVANQVQNDQGTIKGNTGVVIQKNAANEKTTLIENISGTIQAGHDTSTNADVVLRAETLNNRKKTFAIGVRNDGSRGEGGGNTTVRYDVQEVTSDSDAARILAERDITLYGGNITNSQSQIHANRNVDLAEGNFTNETQELTTTRVATTVRRWTTKKCKWYGSCTTTHHSSTSTDTQLQANETQTVYGTLSARDAISTDVGTLAITGVSQGVERVGLVAGDTNTAVSGASGLAAAANTNINITLPTGQYGEFITKKGAGFKYLVETNPELVDMATFMGSEYFISKAGFDPNALAKRLGDAAYETHLITKEIFKRTGQRFLSDAVTNNADQMQRLMDAAAIEQTNLNLSFGVELSAAQVAALTSDIIWMVEREVEGETVLVPELYLASVTRDNLSKRGSAIVASNLNIKAVDLVMKNGRLEGKNSVILNTTGSVLNRGGVISSDGNVQVASLGDINIQSGQIEGDAVTLQAANDINIDTVNTTVKKGINDDNLLNQQAALTSKSDLVVTAGRDLGLKGAKLTSEGKATLSSKGDTNIQTAQYRDSYDANMGAVIDRRHEVKNLASTIKATGDLSLTSDNNLLVQGSSIGSDQNVDIDVKGDTVLTAAQDTLSAFNKVESDKGSFFGGSSSSETRTNKTTQIASAITAGGNLEINADREADGTITNKGSGDVTIEGSSLKADGEVIVQAEKSIILAALKNSESSFTKTEDSGFFTGTKDKTETAKQRLVRASITSGSDITLRSATENIVVKASNLDATAGVTLEAENGVVALLTDKESDYFSQDTEDKGFYIKSIQKGNSDETVKHSEINVGSNLVIKAGLGVVVEYRGDGGLDGAVDSLSKQPGLEWMAQVKERDDVNWNAIQEAHKSWHEENETLNPAAGAVIAIALAAVTAGAGLGAALVGTGTSLQTALAAGINAMAAQAGTSLVANKGDIGAVFKELASSRSLRNLAATMVTAGVLNGITPDALAGSYTSLELPQQIQRAALEISVKTAAQTVINGQDLGSTLKNSLISTATQVIGAELAEEIGGAYAEALKESNNARQPLDYVLHKVAHAALGCASGAASGGDCGIGAVAGAVGAITSEAYKEFTQGGLEADLRTFENTNPDGTLTVEQQVVFEQWRTNGIQISRISGALAAALAGADSTGIYAGADASENVAENNVLPALILLAKAGMAAYTLYEVYDKAQSGLELLEQFNNGTLKEDQLKDKLIDLGIDLAIDVTAGKVSGPAVAVLGTLAGKSGLGARFEAIYKKIADGGGNVTRQLPTKITDNGKTWNKSFFNGRSVYKNDGAFDPKFVDAKGRSNIQRMQEGLAPVGKDGKSVELHHMAQQEVNGFNGSRGAVAEVNRDFHSKNYNTIHIYKKGDPEYVSWRQSNPQAEKEFNKFRKEYWKDRAGDFE
ncbi:DUF637 domain-containing protein [Terasakiella pusilla]|uniref:two-partner secretion domain-containing protein n=1 Tax=Terasakiella pusilla TaxID=64973 RepID=UPI003AA9ADD5